MACGVPVVSTNTGGTPEVVEDGVAGLLNAVGDTKAMAANAVSILRDAATLQAYRDGALRTAGKFEIGNVLPRYEALYREVVEQVNANGIHQ
jgi:glycosyltransferase involved in cell wall biosynthesis